MIGTCATRKSAGAWAQELLFLDRAFVVGMFATIVKGRMGNMEVAGVTLHELLDSSAIANQTRDLDCVEVFTVANSVKNAALEKNFSAERWTAPGCEQPVAMPPGLWACWPAGLLPKPAEVEQLELLPPGCEGLLVLLPLVSGQLGAVVGRVGSAAAAVAPALGLVAFAAAAFAVDCLALVAAFHLMACLHLACSLKL